MIKKDMLSQMASNNTMDLMLDNTPRTITEIQRDEIKQPTITSSIKDDIKKNDTPKIETRSKDTEIKDKAKKQSINEDKQMLSFRIPKDIIENINKYSYVERMTKQEVIIKGLEKFFNSKEVKDILSQYDEIKK